MKKNSFTIRLLIFFIIAFIGLYFTLYLLQPASLIDDITNLNIFHQLQNGALQRNAVFCEFFADQNEFSRPFNALVNATMMYISYYEWMPFLVNIIFFCLNLFLLYKIIDHYFNNKNFALIIVFLAMIFPFSNATMFANIMIVSNIPILLFLLSIICIYQNKIFCYFLAGLFIFASTLIYEINVFMIPILAILLINETQNLKKLLVNAFLSMAFPLILMILYKKVLGFYFYENYVPYTDNKFDLGTHKFKDFPISFFKTYFLDNLFLIKRAFIAIEFYSIYDYILVALSLIISFLIIKQLSKIKLRITIFHLLFFAIAILLAHGIFMISVYNINTYGFENRTLGWARITFAIFITSCIIFIFNRLQNNFIKNLLSIFIFFLMIATSITIISEKNAWQFAGKFNEEMFIKLNTQLPEKLEGKSVLVSYQKNLYKQFVADEPTLKSDYELNGLAYSINKRQNINGQFIQLKSFYWDELLGKKINNRETNYTITKNFIQLKNRTYPFPLYIFDYEKNKLHLISSKEAFYHFLKNQ